MSFAMLPAAAVAAGLGVLALVLYALQLLRTRHREVTVVTTLFWRAAIEQAPVRKLREAFRHPWAYALALAICSLLWLAAADPRVTDAEAGEFHVLLLDGSAAMARAGRFEHAVETLRATLARLPEGSRRVVWCGGSARPLLDAGEHALLLDARLRSLRPEPAPATVERELRYLASSSSGRPTRVVVFGDAQVRRQVLDELSATVRVERATLLPDADGNNGITTLGLSEAASGAWDRVDLLVGVHGADAPSAAGSLRIELDGEPFSGVVTRHAADPTRVQLRDVPAAGGLLTVTLAGSDALALDDRASVRLPLRPRLAVALSPSLQAALGAVLQADPAVELIAAGGVPDVVIRRAGEAIGGDAPALEFPVNDGQPAFVVQHPEGYDPEWVLLDAVNAIGLQRIDAMELAESFGQVIEVAIEAGPQWRISAWAELLSARYDFTGSRAFPLFVANAVRWLSGVPDWHQVVAAGSPLAGHGVLGTDRVLAEHGAPIDTLGVPFVPERAGALELESGAPPLEVALLDPVVTVGMTAATLPASANGAGPMPERSLAILLAWLALLALAVDWILFQRRRIP